METKLDRIIRLLDRIQRWGLNSNVWGVKNSYGVSSREYLGTLDDVYIKRPFIYVYSKGGVNPTLFYSDYFDMELETASGESVSVLMFPECYDD